MWQNPLKIYLAGKIHLSTELVLEDNSSWRDTFCKELSTLINRPITNLDPTKSCPHNHLDESDSLLMVGRDAYMIQQADIVIVNLTDDISVGGSQEMLIAKMYSKPLIGIAPLGGKFRKQRVHILGKNYTNWTHPFVAVTCDRLAEDIHGAAIHIQSILSSPHLKIKGIEILEQAQNHYKNTYLANDTSFFN